MNWKALIYAMLSLGIPLALAYIIFIIGGTVAKVTGIILMITFLILAILALYWAYDDEMRNKP